LEEDVYIRIREFLDRLPGQFPATESGVELRILRRLFTPEEAEMLLMLTQYPQTPRQVAEKSGGDPEWTAEVLESMARQGSIYRFRQEDKSLYLAVPFIVGIFEFHLKSLDRELAELIEEYKPYLIEAGQSVTTKQLRVVPVGDSVSDETAVKTYDSIRSLVEKHDRFAVAQCICRKEQGLLGRECERPQETCLTFGFAADYYIENGIGREISLEEVMNILDTAEDSALVLAATNSCEIVNVCCCCGCCCGMIRAIKDMPQPARQIQSSHRAYVDPGLCDLCGTCLERCQIDALIENEEYVSVDEDRCVGCGLCVTKCPADAVTMVCREDTVTPPSDILDMSLRITRERELAG